MWRPEKRSQERGLWFSSTPPASQRANSCFMLRKSRPNDRFFMSNPWLPGISSIFFFPKPIYFKGNYKVHNFFKILAGYPGRSWMVFWCCCSSGSRPLFTGGASLWSLQSAAVTRLQMSVGKKGKKAQRKCSSNDSQQGYPRIFHKERE